MNDLISRRAAINTAIDMFDCCDTCDIVDYRDLMIEALSVLPSAQSERKRGKWIYLFDKNGRSEWGCLHCSHIVYTDDRTERPEDRGIYYCPHCCSDNREENNNG